MNEENGARAPEGVILYTEELNPPDDKPASYDQIFSLIGMLIVGQVVLIAAIFAVYKFGRVLQKNWKNKKEVGSRKLEE